LKKTENWGRRKLAYEIAGHREGVYVLEVINGPGAMTAELDRRLRVFDVVIRHMVVRVVEDLAVPNGRARAARSRWRSAA
jgi:small subunit ribosomal protein S6